MAVDQLNRTRRALLGAAVAWPLSAAAVGVPGAIEGARGHSPGSAGDWRAALDGFLAAEGELRSFEARTAGAPWEAQAAIEAAYGPLSDRMYDALRRLLRTPAPGLAALAAKIALAVDHEVGTLSGGEACMDALKEDALRLAFG